MKTNPSSTFGNAIGCTFILLVSATVSIIFIAAALMLISEVFTSVFP